jgi:hypothetical protein
MLSAVKQRHDRQTFKTGSLRIAPLSLCEKTDRKVRNHPALASGKVGSLVANLQFHYTLFKEAVVSN